MNHGAPVATQVPSAAVKAPEVPGNAASRGTERDHPEIVIDGSTHWSRWWSDLYVYRGALQSLAWRNIRSRYKQAALGVSWAVLQPALQVVVFTLLFGVLAKIPSGDVPYPLFALAGLLPWNLFSKITSEGAQSLVVNQHLISKLFFPRIYLVLAAGASAVLDAAMTLLFLVVMMLAYGVVPGYSVVLALPVLAWLALFSFGFAALLAAVNARWRDVQHTLPLVLQVGLFVTPVVYQSSYVPERWRWLLAINPLSAPVDAFRSATLSQPMPPSAMLITSLVVGMIITVAGFWVFARTEASLADVA